MDNNPSSKNTTLPAFMGADEVRRAAEQMVHLVVMSGNNIGQVFTLGLGRSIVGRDDTAEIQIMDAGISRSHAAVFWDSQRSCYVLEDLGSRNGVSVNGERVSGSVPLQKGDKVQLGLGTVLRVSFSDELETQYASRMYQAVLRDGLTGAYNRRYFDERLSSEVAFAMRHQTALSLVLLDIDHFKSINDTYGHSAGDMVLKETAGLVMQTVRAEDVFARFGGEEFAVIGRGIREDQGVMLAERVRVAVAKRAYVFEGTKISVTISFGVADVTAITEATGALAFIEAADKSLYEAKKQGRNRVVCFSKQFGQPTK